MPELIQTVDVPDYIYDEVETQVSISLNLRLPDLIDEPKQFEAQEKDYDDALFENASGSFANSLQRVLFYLELSRIAGVSLFVSRAKKDFIEGFGAQLPDVFRQVENRVDDAMRKRVLEILGNASRSFEFPPLVEHILRYAYDNKLSLLESALQLHRSKAAIGFRKWLADTEQDLRAGGRPGEIETAGKMGELVRLANAWAEALDACVGRRYERRTA